MRPMDASTRAAFASGVIRPVVFVWLDWPGGDVRVHDRLGEIAFDGETFLGLGNLGEISGVTESPGLAVREVTLTLTAPLGEQAGIGQPNIRNRECKIWLGALREDHATLAGAPLLLFRGWMRALSFRLRRLGETDIEHRLQLTVQRHFGDVRRKRVRRHDHPSLAGLREQVITWPE